MIEKHKERFPSISDTSLAHRTTFRQTEKENKKNQYLRKGRITD